MKNSVLNARRIAGDLDLGLDAVRVNGKTEKAWSRADFPGGKLPSGSTQSVYDQSSGQSYRIGTRRIEYGRTFRYSKAGATLTSLARLRINRNYAPGVTGHVNENGFEGALSSQAAAGALYVDLADTTVRAADYYAGGLLAVFGTLRYIIYNIVASDLGTGVYVRCYLDEPVKETITTGYGVTAYLSPYSNVGMAGSRQVGFETFVGCNLVPVTSGYWFWLQTKGPCIITPTGVTWPGSAANLRDVYANPNDGTIQPPTLSDPSSGYQRIGSLLSLTGGTASDYGDLLVQLQLE